MLSEEVVSTPAQPSDAVPVSLDEVQDGPAFPPEPPTTQQQSLDDKLGRSDTESLGPAEEFTFLFQHGGRTCVLLCFSLRLWPLVRQISSPAQVATWGSLV